MFNSKYKDFLIEKIEAFQKDNIPWQLPFSFFLYEKKDNQLWWYFNGWVTFLFDSATLRASYFMVKETRKVLQRKLCQF